MDYLAYWGYATSLVTVLVAILGPTLGTMSDLQGRKKKFFLGSVLIGSVGCVVLGFMQSWIWFLVLFVLSKTAYSSSLVFYDAMLPDITQRERMDEVSSYATPGGISAAAFPLSPACFWFYPMSPWGSPWRRRWPWRFSWLRPDGD